MRGTWACAQCGATTTKRRWRHIGHGNRGRLLRCSPVLRAADRYALGCRAVGDKDSLKIQAGMHNAGLHTGVTHSWLVLADLLV